MVAPDYPNIKTGLNEFSADVFNRVMDDLRSGENNWEALKGLIRETAQPAAPFQTNPWQLCIIGANYHLDPRDNYQDDNVPLYYGQRMYEWCSVAAQAMSLSRGHNDGGHIDEPEDSQAASGYEWNDQSCGNPGTPLISRNSSLWPNLFNAHADPQNGKSPLHVWDNTNQPSEKKYYWRMADNGGVANLKSGAAMNIAEASHSFYGTPGDKIFPGLNWRNSCLSNDISDDTLIVQPIESGTLVFMTLVPFYSSLVGQPEDGGGCPSMRSEESRPPIYVNCFTCGPNISACCEPPSQEGAAAAAVGSIPFFDNTEADRQSVSGDLYYDKDTKTLHTPNITTDGTSPSLGYSTDVDAVYIGNAHAGTGSATSTLTSPDPALFQPWVFTESVRTLQVTMDGTGAKNVGQLNIALYNSAYGRPTTKIAGSGATLVGNGSGTTTVSYDVTIPAGAYWLGCCSNSGIVKIAGTSSGDADSSYIPRTTANLSGSFCIWKSSSDLTSLPESISATSELTSSDDTVPRIGFRYQEA